MAKKKHKERKEERASRGFEIIRKGAAAKAACLLLINR